MQQFDPIMVDVDDIPISLGIICETTGDLSAADVKPKINNRLGNQRLHGIIVRLYLKILLQPIAKSLLTWRLLHCVYPIVAKVGGLQSQGDKCEAVVLYCERLTTRDLEPSGFPGEKRWHTIDPILKFTIGLFLECIPDMPIIQS